MTVLNLLLSLFLVTLFSIVGKVLFKHGVNIFGKISLQRMLRARIDANSYFYLSTLGIGTLLIVIASLGMKESVFALRLLFSMPILCGMILMFASRMLTGIPLSITGLGRFYAIITILNTIITILISSYIFKEVYSLKTLIGILVGLLGIILIGGKMKYESS